MNLSEMTTDQILLSHGEENEITSYPWWGICKKCTLGVHLLAGVWFNRPDAEKYLETHRRAYGDKAFVYCFSGCNSTHLRQMYKNAKGEKE